MGAIHVSPLARREKLGTNTDENLRRSRCLRRRGTWSRRGNCAFETRWGGELDRWSAMFPSSAGRLTNGMSIGLCRDEDRETEPGP